MQIWSKNVLNYIVADKPVCKLFRNWPRHEKNSGNICKIICL